MTITNRYRIALLRREVRSHRLVCRHQYTVHEEHEDLWVLDARFSCSFAETRNENETRDRSVGLRCDAELAHVAHVGGLAPVCA